MPRLILLRHGESEWNKDNRFTGWTDVDLSTKGRQEALAAGQEFLKAGFEFDVVYTSVLKRAIRTVWIVLEEMDRMWLPVSKSWQLNERHYGALQGLNKDEIGARFGQAQLHLWRRSYNVRPPLLEVNDQRYPGRDARYALLQANELPLGESLKDTAVRLQPYWQNSISASLLQGQAVLVVAHGNSLRALVKSLDGISDADICDLEIPTGGPLVYELNRELQPVGHYYLNSNET